MLGVDANIVLYICFIHATRSHILIRLHFSPGVNVNIQNIRATIEKKKFQRSELERSRKERKTTKYVLTEKHTIPAAFQKHAHPALIITPNQCVNYHNLAQTSS